MKIDLLVADDHPTVIAGILYDVAQTPGIHVVGTAKNSTEIIDLLQSTRCDVLLTDYSMPGGQFGDGLMLLSFLMRRFPDVRMVVFTMMDNPAIIQQMLKIGIRAIVSKKDELHFLTTAINEAYVGGTFFSPSISGISKLPLDRPGSARGADSVRSSTRLSPKELEFLRLFASGLAVGQIAESVHRSKQTISGQKASLKRKLGITRDTDLFRYAYDNGLVMGKEDRPGDIQLPDDDTPAGDPPGKSGE